MKIDYSNVKKAEAIPQAASMIETFRAIGYSIETAIADIIDNSISAKAKNIYINRIWRGGKSIISIKDDGCGMSDDEITHAMRPGSQNPLSDRNENDLGRFGLGLKTASFSQCRKLSVLSKKEGHPSSFWTWDLDYVALSNKWELLHWIPEEYLHELDADVSGTIVIWSELDRILPLETAEQNNESHRNFSNLLGKVKKHIQMTFHRFIEEKSIKIFWCGYEIEAWNPFCTNEPKTQASPTEFLYNNIEIKGYVLPHKHDFSSEESFQQAEGMNGYSEHQGFYVYRGKRLLLAGNWLGLFKKEEHHKLVRIRIDLPNTLDSDWQIDIKKSKATPPICCLDQLKSYAASIRSKGSEVYRHRGKILKQRAGQNFQPLWLEKKKDNRWEIVINREHILISNLKETAKTKPSEAIERLLKFIEKTIPINAIYSNQAQSESSQKQPFTDTDLNMISEEITALFNKSIADGLSPSEAKKKLKATDPFNNYEFLIDNLS